MIQPGAGNKQTAWKAAVAVVAYSLLLRCGLMDLQERLLSLGCACLYCSSNLPAEDHMHHAICFLATACVV